MIPTPALPRPAPPPPPQKTTPKTQTPAGVCDTDGRALFMRGLHSTQLRRAASLDAQPSRTVTIRHWITSFRKRLPAVAAEYGRRRRTLSPEPSPGAHRPTRRGASVVAGLTGPSGSFPQRVGGKLAAKKPSQSSPSSAKNQSRLQDSTPNPSRRLRIPPPGARPQTPRTPRRAARAKTVQPPLPRSAVRDPSATRVSIGAPWDAAERSTSESAGARLIGQSSGDGRRE